MDAAVGGRWCTSLVFLIFGTVKWMVSVLLGIEIRRPSPEPSGFFAIPWRLDSAYFR
jgi:hypothetical protein